ncbi:MarR family winged helix-turn-helix transcriptional regulator [Jiangella anatolica]|uniref:MarR family transcriptional regulator n=1 Tax=Jiangella anatolica TaxID=2670374 RepID=A0A2W2BSM8_9ACTN|nr:MarR family transcriptional regulator [Jiangella anatolica]PZF79189.1 MarR family transcriptional regulator [Jiangella anatolica]
MTASKDTDQWVTAEQLEVWRLFIRAQSRVIRRLEADLLAEHELPLAWYDVLVRLLEADGRRLRMSDLAERVLLSPSGLTRLVDRMVEEGFVERAQAERDGRGFYAVLTDAGYERLRDASGTHLRGVHDYVVGRFDDTELATLADLLRRLDP